MGIHQTNFDRYPGKAFPGQQAFAGAPTLIKRGTLNADAAADRVRPGYPVFYNQTTNFWERAKTPANQKSMMGIVVAESGVATQGTSVPSGANSPDFLEFSDNATIQVMLIGGIYVLAGSSAEFGDILEFKDDDQKWDKITVPAVAASAASIKAYLDILPRNPVRLMEPAVSDGDLAIAYIGQGGAY